MGGRLWVVGGSCGGVTGGGRRMGLVRAFSRFGSLGDVGHSALVDVLRRSFHDMLSGVCKASRGFSIVVGPRANSYRVLHAHAIIRSKRLTSSGERISLARTGGVSRSCRINRSIISRVSFLDFNHHTMLGLHRALTSGVLRLRGGTLCRHCTSIMNRVIAKRICRI